MDKSRWSPLDNTMERAHRRRDRIAAEIERNRRGEVGVPTWVLTAILVAIVAAFVFLLVFS